MDMEILLTHEKGLLFSGANSTGTRVSIGRPSDYPEATSPMELLLEALAGCSSIDVLMILEKQKARVDRYQVRVLGHREEVGAAKPFTAVDMEYSVDTDALPAKVARALQLSLEKYCSVAKTIERSVAIHYALVVNGRPVEFPEKE